jgi:hypothetical protein
MKLLLLAALVAPLLAPAVTHAERLAPKHSELRQTAALQVAPSKRDRTPLRTALRPTVETAAAPRGLEIGDVLAKVNGAYLAGVQRCFRKSLAIDPTVSSKLDLVLEVAADGRVTSALGNDGFERCMANLTATWRFGIALDDAGMPTTATFKISLLLPRN